MLRRGEPEHNGSVRLCVAHPDGSLDVREGLRPAARSGHALVALEDSDVIPLPEGSTIAHLPGRRAQGVDRHGRFTALDDRWVPVAAILPVGHLRTLLPASQPVAGSRRLPLFGYTAVAERDGEPSHRGGSPRGGQRGPKRPPRQPAG
jgi:hypothetical protein